MRELLDSFEEVPLLLAGRPVRCLRGPFPEDHGAVVEAARGQCDLMLLDAPSQSGAPSPSGSEWIPLSVADFSFPVFAGIGAGIFARIYSEPLNLGSTVAQNEFELLRRARENNSAEDLLVLEDQGNLIWGRSHPHNFGRTRSLQVSGLILNKPHFYPVLLKRLLIEKRVALLRGRLGSGSPLRRYLSLLPGRTENSRMWARISADSWMARRRVDIEKIHLFLNERAK